MKYRVGGDPARRVVFSPLRRAETPGRKVGDPVMLLMVGEARRMIPPQARRSARDWGALEAPALVGTAQTAAVTAYSGSVNMLMERLLIFPRPRPLRRFLQLSRAAKSWALGDELLAWMATTSTQGTFCHVIVAVLVKAPADG